MFQVQESAQNLGGGLNIHAAGNLEQPRSALVAVVQFHSSLREVAVKSGCDSRILGLGAWSSDKNQSVRGPATACGQASGTANFLDSFKSSGVPEPILERGSLSGSTRIQGPWSKVADGVVETIQVLDTAEIDEGAKTLTSKEAKLLVCKQMIEASCSMSDLRDYDYAFYLQNRSNFAADMKLVRAERHMVGNVLSDQDMFVWQRMVIDMISEYPVDERKILWIFDALGGSGKSALTKYLAVQHRAYVTGEAARYIDIAEGYQPFEIHGRLSIFHYSRANSANVCYSAMESLKDGMMFSSKYQSAAKEFPPTHVIVMSNSPPVVEGNLSYDRLILLDISKLPEEFKQRGALPSRQNTGPGVPRIFDWCYRLEKDPSNVGNDGFSWVSWPLAPANLQPVNDLAEDASERSSAKGSSPGFADDNICNSPLSASQSSDNEDGWEAMEAAAPSGGNWTVALDVDTAHRLAAAPACAGVIANDQVDSNSSAREYPENFANLADEILAAVVLASEPLSASSEQSAEDRADQSPNSEPLATAPNDVIRVIDCNSNVDLEDLQQLCGELPQQSQSEATTESQTSGSPARKHKTLGKRDRKYFAAVGSADNPAMQREPRKRKTAT